MMILMIKKAHKHSTNGYAVGYEMIVNVPIKYLAKYGIEQMCSNTES